MKLKKGMTLAEVLIVLIIIGVISTMTLTIMNNNRANSDHLMFRKAYQLTSNIVSELVNDPELYPDENSNLSDTTGPANGASGEEKFCILFSSRVNTIDEATCEEDNDIDITDPNSITFQFTTTDGIAWYLPITEFNDTTPSETEGGEPTPVDDYLIYIDTNGADNEPNCFATVVNNNAVADANCPRPDRFRINLRRNGMLNLNEFPVEQLYLRDHRVVGGN